MRRVIHIGEGRHIEIEEGELQKPAPPTQPKKSPHREVRGTYASRYTIPFYREWHTRRMKQSHGLTKPWCMPRNRPKFMKAAEFYRLRDAAMEQVKKDMENIKKAGIDLDTAAEEALSETLSIMRGPGKDANLKLRAARQVLEWTKAKPAAKSDVTVHSAEAWLDSLGHEPTENEEEDDEAADS